MSKDYYLHRISHEDELSYPLYNEGYLSIGYSAGKDIGLTDKNSDYWEVREKYEKIYPDYPRKYNGIWRFCHMKEGDIVVVPLYSGKFSICEVTGNPISVSDSKIERIKSWDIYNNKNLSENIFLNEDGLYQRIDEKLNYTYDIGYLVPVKFIEGKREVSRKDFADSRLESRMKVRCTNVCINDIKDSVDEAICIKESINIENELKSEFRERFLLKLKKMINPSQFEELIKWYFEKLGASDVYIPAKNESGKEGGADADIVAVFDSLKTIYYVQAKKHDGETDKWAIDQITMYVKQKNENSSKDDRDNYTLVPWVVSTADKFSEEAEKAARDSEVILVDGNEFAEMIIDLGIKDINNIMG